MNPKHTAIQAIYALCRAWNPETLESGDYEQVMHNVQWLREVRDGNRR